MVQIYSGIIPLFMLTGFDLVDTFYGRGKVFACPDFSNYRQKLMTIKTGDMVEFTTDDQPHYTLGDDKLARFGVAIQDEKNCAVMVELADGSKVTACHIHAYGWGGFIPDELEKIWEKYNPDDGEMYGDGDEDFDDMDCMEPSEEEWTALDD